MKALDDLRATVRTDNDGMTMVTTRVDGKSRTVVYTKDEAMQLIGALALSVRHPLMTFNVDWSREEIEPFDMADELKKGFPKLDTTETGTTMGELRKETGEPYGVSERLRPALRVSAREAETKMIREPDPIRCASCGSFTHAHMRRCVACDKPLHEMPTDVMAREKSPHLKGK